MPDFPTTPRPSRRALLGGALGLGVLLAGCSSEDTPTRPSATPAEPGLAPDVAVATTALAQITVVREGVEGTIARYPALRGDLLGVAAMHKAHEAALADAVPERARPSASPAPYVVPGRLPVATSRLADAERALHDTLGRLALGAESGDFARLLASMGAGVDQRLARWPS